ncbi:NADP oxidoreductase [Actinorhabdospora filicis]|uniref:NADP oxidoreductase n=1 Tax=Actinorhabdospora filicis TaxID=1785913 RepID=A0A9W6SEU0_9ACTN|nr:NAD(P)-binding domain-containing protein [Actinorhabdospora filicis]GLZ75880.1 NADP oxidoreductase [Actinorhabdospora filicis]
MKIGVIGNGSMAAVLGGRWAAAGHDVLFGGRDTARAASLAARLTTAGTPARAGTPAEAAAHGTGAVLLAVPADAAPKVAAILAAELTGRTVIDCANPVGPGFLLTGPPGTSTATAIAAAAPSAHIVKAFNLCHESVWATPPVYDGRPLAVPLCGDDPTALTTARRLTTDLGATPVDAGGLNRAALLEATAALVIGLWVGAGADAQAILPPLTAAGPVG